MEETIIVGFMDELAKIAASKGSARYMQTRQGTRPIRVSTLLANESRNSVTQDTDLEQPDPPINANEGEGEGDGDGGAVKMAKKVDQQGKVLERFAKARPYIVSAVKGAVPGALLGNTLAGLGTAAGRHSARVGAIIGGGLGLTNRSLTDWAEKNKRTRAARELLKKD